MSAKPYKQACLALQPLDRAFIIIYAFDENKMSALKNLSEAKALGDGVDEGIGEMRLRLHIEVCFYLLAMYRNFF